MPVRSVFGSYGRGTAPATLGEHAPHSSADELRQIVELQVQRLRNRQENCKLGLELNGEAIAKAIQAGTFPEGSTIAVDVEAAAEPPRLRLHQAEPAGLLVLV